MCADDTAPLCIGTHTSFAMLSPSSQPLSGLVKQWVGDRLRRGPEALLRAAARRGPEAALRVPAATTRDLPPQVPHGTEEQSNPNMAWRVGERIHDKPEAQRRILVHRPCSRPTRSARPHGAACNNDNPRPPKHAGVGINKLTPNTGLV